MKRKIKKRYISIALFYFLIVLLGFSIMIDPVIPAKIQDIMIGILIISNLHFLNERNILFKRVKFFAEEIENIKNKEEEKEEFVANITHDLKTPTLAQIGAIKMLLKNKLGYLNFEQENLLKAVLSSCNYMAEMISTIISTYKHNGGKINFKFEDFNINEIVHQICSNLSDLASENEQNIILNMEDNLVVHADKLQISRVITNLISNAIKYGLKRQDVFVNINGKDKKVLFEVKNKYKNEEKQSLDKLFNKFETSDKTSTGLGLYISKKIIEEHKGNIFAKYNRDKIIFGFILPLVCTDICIVKSKNHLVGG